MRENAKSEVRPALLGPAYGRYFAISPSPSACRPLSRRPTRCRLRCARRTVRPRAEASTRRLWSPPIAAAQRGCRDCSEAPRSKRTEKVSLSNSIRLRDERAQAGDIAAWMRQRGDHADAQRLSEGGHDDGDGRGGGFRGPRCRRSAGHDQVDAVAHQLRDELAETL